MATRLTEAEQAMSAPGACTRCGTYAQDRNTAGQCNDCHNQGVHERQARQRAANRAAQERGRIWWAAQGITVGDEVQRLFPSIFGGAILVHGTARAGAVGAYVRSTYQAGYLSPQGWRRTPA